MSAGNERAGGEGEDNDSADEEAILSRRRAFVVGTLATVLLVSSEACKNPFVAETPTAEDAAAPRPCLQPTVPLPPPMPCLSTVPIMPDAAMEPVPVACLSPAPCLSIARPRACLSPPVRHRDGVQIEKPSNEPDEG